MSVPNFPYIFHVIGRHVFQGQCAKNKKEYALVSIDRKECNYKHHLTTFCIMTDVKLSYTVECQNRNWGLIVDLWQDYPTNFESDFFARSAYPSPTNTHFLKKILDRRFRVEITEFMRAIRDQKGRNSAWKKMKTFLFLLLESKPMHQLS